MKKKIAKRKMLSMPLIKQGARDKNNRIIKDGDIIRLGSCMDKDSEYLTCVVRVSKSFITLSPDIDGKWPYYNRYNFNDTNDMNMLKQWGIIDPFWGYVNGQED